MKARHGFTLLEVMVATTIMGIAVVTLLSALSTSVRNATRLTDYDRATLLARQKMDELLVDQKAPRNIPFEGPFNPAQSGGITGGWRARVAPFEAVPGSGPGNWGVDRVELEIWWMNGTTRRSFSLEGFRRTILQPGDRLQ